MNYLVGFFPTKSFLEGNTVDLRQIVSRVSEGLVAVDNSTTAIRFNRRNGEVYDPGVKTLSEPDFVAELALWWEGAYPSDFVSVGKSCQCSTSRGSNPELEHNYTNTPRAKCDFRFSSDGSAMEMPEWAIEFKHIALVGNNGKNNDYGVAKMLSPYLKDRSLLHDIERMRHDPQGKKQAVIGYCFEYSFESLDFAEKIHPGKLDVIGNIRSVCRSVDRSRGVYSPLDLIDFAGEIYTKRGLVSPVVSSAFSSAWKHPAGGDGHIFAWQLI
jgi:hypothetical protein